jgi:hypothetical protein
MGDGVGDGGRVGDGVVDDVSLIFSLINSAMQVIVRKWL